MTTLDQAAQQMLAAGMPPFPVGHPRANTDRVQRYGPKSKAWYRLYEFTSPKTGRGFVSGSFGLFHGADDVIGPRKIEADTSQLDPAEREQALSHQRDLEAKERAARFERQQFAANRARRQWESAGRTGPWPYLDRKQISAQQVRCLDDGTLLVPMIDYELVDGQPARALVGLQKIAPDGTKRFTKGMAKEGAALRLNEDDQGPVVFIAEGYATARTIAIVVPDAPVYVAFDAGNLVHVARRVRAWHKDAFVIVAADDDFQTQGNPGITWACAAAAEVGARAGKASVIAPAFATDRVDKLTDFNDLLCREGLPSVEAQLREAMAAALLRLQSGPASPALSVSTPPPAAAAEQPPDPDWQRFLTRDRKGIKPTLNNIGMILAEDDDWRGVIAKNEFTEAVDKLRPPPYPGGVAGEWVDIDDIRTRAWLERKYGFSCRRDDLVDAVLEIADRCRYHPVRDWLDQLPWDGQDRVDGWAARYLGTRDTAYAQAVSRKFLLQMVARIYRPGCKADTVMILEGTQGLRKSTALKTLAGKYFTDTPLKIGDKESYVLMQGMWLVEMAELDSLSRAETSASKLFFSQSENHYRPWYAKRPVKVKRQCVITGSVNNAEYLRDDTGNRRYWPLACYAIDIEGLAAVREQLFAEAVVRYRAGEIWWVSEDEKLLFSDEQAARFVSDAWTEVIAAWMNSEAAALRDEFSLRDIMGSALKMETQKWTKAEQMRAGHCMRELGFCRKRSSKTNALGGRDWVYTKGDADASPPDIDSGAKRASGDEQDVPL